MGRSLFHSKPLQPPPLPLPPPPLPTPPLSNHNAFPIFSKTAGHGESSFMADAYLLWMDFSHERDQLGYWNGFKGRYCIDLLLYLPWYCCTMFKIMITLINDIAFCQDMSFRLYALCVRDRDALMSKRYEFWRTFAQSDTFFFYHKNLVYKNIKFDFWDISSTS